MEELLYDFSKTTYDTVTIRYYPPYDTITVIVVYDGMKNIFGRLRRQWGFYESSRRTSMYVLREITDSIGLTYVTFEPGVITDCLRGAIINGIRYGTITTVESNELFYVKDFELYQNYPNPFNVSTVIEFSLPSEDKVQISIYDILGRLVTRLVDERRGVGRHRLIFDGSGLSSGLYLLRLHVKESILTKKMILLQ